MKLYYAPKTRAGRCRWLLEELGVPYELSPVSLKEKEQRQPKYLAVNPFGGIPALEDGKIKMFESGAICAYLADKYPEKKMAPPTTSPDRATYYQWLFFSTAAVEPPMMVVAQHTKFLPEEKRIPAVVETAKKDFARAAKVLAEWLQGKTFLVAEQFTAADVMIGSMLEYSNYLGLLGDYPVLLAYVARLKERSAFQRSRQD